MRDTRRTPRQVLSDLRLPRAERGAARAERLVEARMRRERDNEETADRRAAAIEAERRRWGANRLTGGGGG